MTYAVILPDQPAAFISIQSRGDHQHILLRKMLQQKRAPLPGCSLSRIIQQLN